MVFTSMTDNNIILYIEVVLGLVALISAIFIAFNMATLKNYKETIKGQEIRIKFLEKENVILAARVDHLESQERGYEFAIRMLVNEIAMSSVCEIAEQCPHRVPPQRLLNEFMDVVGEVREKRSGI